MINRYWKLPTLVLSWLLLSAPVPASNVEFVTVVTPGIGLNKSEAINNALIAALEQVNGTVMSSKMKSVRESIKTINNGVKTKNATAALKKDISKKTKGVIRKYTPVSFSQMKKGKVEATVEVTVAVLKESQQLNRTRIAVVNSGASVPQVKQMRREVARLLTSSRKFAVLDRENNAVVQQEFNKIQATGSIADMVRITSGAAPDLLLIIKAELSDAGNNKVDLIATLEVLNYSSRQVKFSREKRIRLKRSDSDSKTKRKVSLLSKKLYNSMVEKVFQPVVIGGDGNKITIGQGKEYFSVGDTVLLHRKGEQLLDHYTGESLGADLTLVGKAEITLVNPNISIAILDSRDSMISNQDIANRRIVVAKQKGQTIKKMRKSTKSFLDDI